MNREFNGKALYRPQGRSGEYARWAINFYNGCTGGCEYCYNKRFPLLSAPTPMLKACFVNPDDAFETARKEMLENKEAIIADGGVFLSFVSDPMLPETITLTMRVVELCGREGIPVMVLTKRADWVLNVGSFQWKNYNALLCQLDDSRLKMDRRNIAFGFTLTGHDELEPGCSRNADRIAAMEILHKKGFRTFASIEPVIDFAASLDVVQMCAPFCDHFKIGLRTDRKFECTVEDIVSFVNGVRTAVLDTPAATVYFKQSLRDLVGGGYIIGSRFVEDGYNMFATSSV